MCLCVSVCVSWCTCYLFPYKGNRKRSNGKSEDAKDAGIARMWPLREKRGEKNEDAKMRKEEEVK